MRGGPQSDHRLAGSQVSVDRFHLVLRQVAPARLDEHQVGVVQMLEPRNVVDHMRVHDARFRIDGEQHCAAETVPRGEHPGQHRKPLFGAVLFIAGNQDHLPTLAGPFPRFVLHPLLGPLFFLARFRVGTGQRASKGKRGGENPAKLHDLPV